MHKNCLYYGDNLTVLREHIKDESVDLIYLDPPFNSRQDYNVLFAERDGTRSASQIMAFEDTWEWNEESARTYEELVERGGDVADVMRAFRTFLKGSDMMAYLAMMGPRLIELHRVLKVTGSIYLHCDPTASHYLKLLMDAVFGPQHFKSEVIWKRTSSHNSAKRFGPVHDVILFFAKSDTYTWNRTFQSYDQSYVDAFYRHKDDRGRFRLGDLTGAGKRTGESGQPWRGVDPTTSGRHWAVPSVPGMEPARIKELSVQQRLDALDDLGLIYWPSKGSVPQFRRYLDPQKGVAAQDVITDIDPLSPHAKERLRYPTQKPEALLERLINASSNEGDIVLDPFCGCGTAIAVAQRLNRHWFGIDITHLAIGLIKNRLGDSFGDSMRETYEVVGEPIDLAGAQKLADEDKFQFQAWALSLVGARQAGGIKKGADRGIDGRLYFFDENKPGRTEKQIIFSVKGGGVQVKDVRDLRGVIERERAEIGVLISMEPPSRPMLKEATDAGFYQPPGLLDKYPRMQVLSVAQLLEGKRVEYPRLLDVTHKKAPRARQVAQEQMSLVAGTEMEEEPF